MPRDSVFQYPQSDRVVWRDWLSQLHPKFNDVSVSAIGSSCLKGLHLALGNCLPYRVSVSAIGSSCLKGCTCWIEDRLFFLFQYPQSDRVVWRLDSARFFNASFSFSIRNRIELFEGLHSWGWSLSRVVVSVSAIGSSCLKGHWRLIHVWVSIRFSIRNRIELFEG